MAAAWAGCLLWAATCTTAVLPTGVAETQGATPPAR